MHVEKIVGESLTGTMLNVPNKTKDGLKAHQDLESLGVKIIVGTKNNKSWLVTHAYIKLHINLEERDTFFANT